MKSESEFVTLTTRAVLNMGGRWDGDKLSVEIGSVTSLEEGDPTPYGAYPILERQSHEIDDQVLNLAVFACEQGLVGEEPIELDRLVGGPSWLLKPYKDHEPHAVISDYDVRNAILAGNVAVKAAREAHLAEESATSDEDEGMERVIEFNQAAEQAAEEFWRFVITLEERLDDGREITGYPFGD